MAARHIVVDPTDGWGEMASHPRTVAPDTFEPGLDLAPLTLRTKYEALGGDGDAARWRARIAENGRIIAALHAAGVPLVAGTDTGLLGYGLDRELELYVEAGISPSDALSIATLGAARAMGRDGQSGSVEAGKQADLVLVRGDPLTRISDLRRVVKVVSAGRLYDSAALAHAVGFRRRD
jgi:imidazolonepropionase-like amidohydrolase